MEKNNKKQINSNRPINFIFILISQFSNIKLLNQTYKTQQSIILANFQHYRPLSSTERQRQIIKRNKFRVPEDRILHEHVRMSFLMRHSEVDKTEMTCRSRSRRFCPSRGFCCQSPRIGSGHYMVYEVWRWKFETEHEMKDSNTKFKSIICKKKLTLDSTQQEKKKRLN